MTKPLDPSPPTRPLQILTTCKGRDLPILEITARKIWQMLPCRALYVVAPGRDCPAIRKSLGSAASVIPEDDFIPTMTIARLKRLPIPNFPQAAGWYFQQLLKLQFAHFDSTEDYYLIWDADTVPLKPMNFFEADGKMLLTKAAEYHAPYFETFRNLFGTEPNREFSMITQHMMVQKSVAREMLARIEQRIEGADTWPWKIMRSLPKAGDNLFSEYETYGHYIKNYYPDRVRFIDRNWRRETRSNQGCALPTEADLKSLAREYEYAAFERAGVGWQRWGRRLAGDLRRILRRG
jgi:hypothetical protein